MSNQDPVKVLVVDDHAGIRNALTRLIDSERPRLCSVGSAATGKQALKLTCEAQPHVIVLDVNLDGEDGLLLIAPLQRSARCQIVVLTSLSDPGVSAQAERLGASAFVHKSAPATELLACILAARLAGGGTAQASPLNAGAAMSYHTGSNHP